MTPQSPVVPGYQHLEIVYAKNQPEYLQLPALPLDDNKRIITRWRMTWRERLRVLLYGDVYLWVSCFGKPLQPVALETTPPKLRI